VLYGGTALALQFGHRMSEYFDFFSSAAFEPAGPVEIVVVGSKMGQ